MFRLTSLVAIAFLLGTTACSDRAEERGLRSASLTGGGRAAPQPEALAQSFFEAVRDQDQDTFESYLTAPARQGLQSGEGGFELGAKSVGAFEIGSATVEGNEATVPVSAEMDGEPQDVRLRMRFEGAAWRVWGIDLVMGEDIAFTLNFEELGEVVDLVEAELTGALEEAFSELSLGGSPEDIQSERARFDALEGITDVEYESSWRVNVSAKGVPAGDVLRDLLSGTEISISSDDVEEHLGRDVDLGLKGVSRLQAIEAICAAVGVHPVYPDPDPWQRSELVLELADGARLHPVSFAGPFMVEVTELEENAPYATGSITLTVRALGIADTVLDFQRSDMVEVLGVDEIAGPEGQNLNGDDGVQFLGTPQIEGRYLSYSTSLDLCNLLRGVEEIGRISGQVHLNYPVEVRTTSWERERTQPKQVGDFTLSLQDWDVFTQFELENSSGDFDGYQVRLSGIDENGDPLGTLSSGWSGWGNKLYPSIQTSEPAAAIDLKICKIEALEYPFTLEHVALQHFSEMPEALAELSFQGEAPLSIEFVRFSKKDDEFPEVELRIENGSNKDVLQTMATFAYLDSVGNVLEEFPHTLTGTFSFEGQDPLTLQGASVVHKTTAFFMPKGTVQLRVTVDEVSFVDATSWSRHQ